MKSHDAVSRRSLLSGVLAVSGLAVAPRTVFALSGVGSSGPKWHQALGWTLVPLETPKQFAAWDDVWVRMRDGEEWLERFRKPLTGSAEDLTLDQAEASIAALLDSKHADGMNSFLNRTYLRVSNNETLTRIIFPEGAFRVGRAAPAIMKKWGYLEDEA